MKNNRETGIKSEKGFTMIELIIVIAVIGILSAILVPSFTTMSSKSKLKADISTIKQLQAQIELYIAEQEGEFPGKENFATDGKLSVAAVGDLVTGNYIKARDTVESKEEAIRTQSKDATILYDSDEEHLKLKLLNTSKEAEQVDKLSEADQEWVSLPTTP